MFYLDRVTLSSKDHQPRWAVLSYLRRQVSLEIILASATDNNSSGLAIDGGHTDIASLGPFYSTQPNGHGLPNLAGLSQASPLQPARVPSSSQQQQTPPNIQHHHAQVVPPPQGQGYALPALGQAMQQQSPQSIMNAERERDYREQDLRELDNRERQRQQEAMLQREHEIERERERELREQQQREQHQPPHENHTGSIPLQQPVASRIPSTLHGPNGILSHLGAGAGPNPPSAPLGAPSGPGNVFGNNMQPAPEAAPRPFLQQPGQNIPPQQLLGFNGTGPSQQLQGGMAALSQGQQPILNVSSSVSTD